MVSYKMINLPPSFIENDMIESVAKGQAIITRFPPEPNGFMHIGHAKALALDFYLAKKYNGTCNLRMDDTNPEKEDIAYVNAIVNDSAWLLGEKMSPLLFASDYYEHLYELAVGLIKKGLAFVCHLTPDEISNTRGSFETPGTDSPHRNRSIEENLQLFQDMRDGKFPDGHCVLRAKIDMAHTNIYMRDPVMYRITRIEHYRTGNKWCIYPLYDYAHPLSDAIENISHSMCSLEFADHQPIYNWYVNNCWEQIQTFDLFKQVIKTKYPKDIPAGLPVPPRQLEFSRLNIEQFVMSKRWLKKFVDNKNVDGWDDPRMPTISGMRNRGYSPEAILEFVASVGVSRTPMCVPLAQLEHFVRAALDPVVTRVSVVFNPIKVVITNFQGGVKKLDIDNHPQNPELGSHKINFGKEIYIDGEDFSDNPPKGWKRLTVDGAVRLRGASTIIRCVAKHKDHLECIIDNDAKPNGVIHFVEATTAHKAQVHEFFPLLKEGTALTEENLNPVTKVVHEVLCEAYLKDVKAGNKFQFVRKGFFIKDASGVFNMTVGLKS